jgi:NAD(P) transhydrogenase subunit beta
MNVLLAEADIPYEKLREMDDINPTFPETDVAMADGSVGFVADDVDTAVWKAAATRAGGEPLALP